MPPSGESVYPSIMGQQTVNVTMPNGTATIPNPLFAYNFHPVIASDFVYNPVRCAQFTDRLMAVY